MALVKNTEHCKKRFKEDFKKGLFSEDDGRVLRAWTREMEEFGPEHIVNSPQWRDHALEREWEGYRASSFSVKGRIIYRIINDDEIEICEVERVSPDHDYKISGGEDEKKAKK